jgi:hypothetical protein
MEWQPIETAPKDGTEFMAYDMRTKKMDVCIMQDTRAWGWVGCPVQSDGEYGPSEDEFGYHLTDITHWMPLPSPPANQQKDEA